MRYKSVGGLLAAATMFVAVLTAGAAPASAAPHPSPALAELLAKYPGATAVSADTIRIGAGMLLSLPARPQAGRVSTDRVTTASSTIHGCSYMYLCLYSEQNYAGYKLSLFDCGFKDLGSVSFPTGGKWNDKMSSWVNNQTPNVLSIFYNWDGVSQWIQVGSGWSGSAAYAPSYNDIVDGVHVC